MPLIPLFILTMLVVVAIFAPLLAPKDPIKGSLVASLTPPPWEAEGTSKYLLGTDFQGRDILSRIIYGARISLVVMICGVLASGATGTFLGLLSGLVGGWVDAFIMRLVDIILSLPGLLIALVLAAAFGASLWNVILVVTISSWVGYARNIRGQVLSLKERDFVLAARAIGASNMRIMRVHLFPNVVATLLVLATLAAGGVILLESTMSFLGVGIPPPQPAWGVMVADGRQWITIAWWVSVMPGIAIALVILSVNLLGDWLRDYLDPTLRGR
jgi:peptide/nickel transport system permease protein